MNNIIEEPVVINCNDFNDHSNKFFVLNDLLSTKIYKINLSH